MEREVRAPSTWDQYGTQYIEVWHIKNYMILHSSWLNFQFCKSSAAATNYYVHTSKKQVRPKISPFSEEDSMDKKWKCWAPRSFTTTPSFVSKSLLLWVL
jgi:hypothetical protein